MSLRCREHFPDGDCLRPAAFIAGSRVKEDGLLAGYPVCDRCAEFWAAECRHKLTRRELDVLELAARWQAVPETGPSKIVKLTPAHRGAA